MSAVRRHRSMIAWMLYACVLYSAFACSLGHGQQSGLALSGIGGLYCTANGDLGASPSKPPAGTGGAPSMPAMGCPLCSAFTLTTLLLGGLLLPGRPGGHPPRPGVVEGHTHPRLTWPSANPRASPA
ncbi:DUF2946 family protein [Pseudomonas solani]|uniref:DUF2946 family protein n=1 Tax=Pseudomonas solani TaxID=2731552 RepID=UPI003C2AC020